MDAVSFLIGLNGGFVIGYVSGIVLLVWREAVDSWRERKRRRVRESNGWTVGGT